MACFAAANSPTSYTSNVTGCTDASSYTVNATSVDFAMKAVNYVGQYDYTLALEVWNQTDGYWMAVELQTGYFAYGVTKRFYLAGKRTGSYRMKGYFTLNGKTYINVTPPFAVFR